MSAAQAPAPLATIALHGERCTIAGNERFALLQGAEGVLLLDLAAAEPVPLPAPGPWQAGAFDASGQQLWLVDAEGTARGFALQAAAATRWADLDGVHEVAIGIPKLVGDDGRPPRFHDLLLAADGAHLAWSLAAGGDRFAGVHAVASGAEVAHFELVDTAAMSDGDQPWIAFVGPGAHVVVQVRANAGGLQVLGHDEPGLMVWDLAARRPITRFAPYVADGTPGYALLRDGLAVGTRNGTRTWPIVQWRLGESAPTVLVPDARGGHFTDLYPDPAGAVLCEWDFEDDDGILVLDLRGKRAPITVAAGHALVGFATAAPGGVLARRADGVLRRFACDTGAATGELDVGAGFTVTAARWCAGVPRILAIGSVDRGNRREWQARLWPVPAAAR
ncbi:MAG: hypothetical protein JNL08_08815 [Planctomycetes bacterium]|nr:hypothetical protein [Planctomycetota bacterium]